MPGRCHLVKFISAIMLLLFAFPVAAKDTFTWYRAPNIKVSFAYSSKFLPSEPIEASTLFAVNWRTKKSGGLMASCYLKIKPITTGSATAARQRLKSDPKIHAEAILDLSRKAGRKVDLVSQKSIKIDDLDAVYFVSKVSSESLDKTVTMDMYQIFTYWDGHGISFICGTPINSQLKDKFKGRFTDEQVKKAVMNVKAEIMKVLRTLHFDRN
jgi:hypothetical protein